VRNVVIRMARAARKFSGRWANELLERLRVRSESEGISTSRLAERYVDEGLRMDEHPGIEFRDGPAGRRASLKRGLDVWELVMVFKDYERHGGDVMPAVAEHLSLDATQVEDGLRYYAAFPEEIDDRIASNLDGWDEAEAAWHREHGAPREAAAR
jgi:hypothetical protein